MATKSIYKDVRLRKGNLCRNFINALENAEGKHSEDVVITKKVRTVKGETIKEIFGK